MQIVSNSKLRPTFSSVSTNHSTIGHVGSGLLILLFSQAPLVPLLPPHMFHLLAAIYLVSSRLVL